jgi:hypothetical protein
MKREKKLTKKEQKAQSLRRTQVEAPRAHDHQHQHIHCTSCGVHLDPVRFEASPATAQWVACEHGSQFASCTEHVDKTKALLDEHDRTGKPVRQAAAWH